jgi:hypothetical protein
VSGSGLREHTRRVGQQHAVLGHRRHVGVVVPHRHIGDDAAAWRSGQKFRVDSIGEHGQHAIGISSLAQQHVARRRLVFAVPDCIIASCSDDVDRSLRDSAGDVRFWSIHGVLSTFIDTSYAVAPIICFSLRQHGTSGFNIFRFCARRAQKRKTIIKIKYRGS